MSEGTLAGLFEASAVAWMGALVGLAIGTVEWFLLPRLMETSIRGSREARKLNKDQLEGVISWWKTVIRVFAVSMPLLGFGLAAAMAE
ncbi:uncharacterized membrane-anchored protein YhcB (DUF1043 family) [Ancylobacter sp. 3268]|uniref:hypothetical protein n=1 Tax=Ancylobacter sp. 3268 TaxID=2817752 RepID=UPI0028571D78|nr:hypothetical protein [Ancylobacter sp. 3268]MDR6953700.1 uncharacterized membrane-anchored protein YhcB (DUF1043 family) [Ancylobacter sp. 3268]